MGESPGPISQQKERFSISLPNKGARRQRSVPAAVFLSSPQTAQETPGATWVQIPAPPLPSSGRPGEGLFHFLVPQLSPSVKWE